MINKDTKLFIFDLDGVLYIGDTPLPMAIDLIMYLHRRYLVRFITNSSSKGNSQICLKLNNMGFKCETHEIFTSSSMTAVYLQENNIDNVYVIGSNSFKNEIQNRGIRIIDNENAKHLVVGMDIGLNYEKLSTGLTILLNKGKFIVCNEDRAFPTKDGYAPGCGAITKALAYSSRRQPDKVIGKPDCYIISKICNDLGINNKETVVVGDSFESDISMALNFGCRAIFLSACSGKIGGVNIVKNSKELYRYIREGDNECIRI